MTPAKPSPVAPGPGVPSATVSVSRSRVDLAGAWGKYVHDKLLETVHVPSSQRPSGYYRLRREIVLPRLPAYQRAILRFEAITYHGRVFVNGTELGTMGPYVPYEFDLSGQAREGSNVLEVAIADLTAEPGGAGKDELALGLNPGWEGYGGIIRDVYVELRPSAFVDNVQLAYALGPGYADAACRARVWVSSSSPTTGQLAVALLQGSTEVARAEKKINVPAGSSDTQLAFDLKSPVLWSPEAPNLYTLRATLSSERGEDEWSCRIGFRDATVRGNRFELNGQPLVLNGVCRHDMWKDQGFTLTRRQMQQDIRMIKQLGCNFVRLVHYPHHRYIIELADELGLLVSEEPGYWNMDFTTMPRSMIELGYRIMERTIRRDWNSPSVFAWLLGNECRLTVEYLCQGKELCRSLDPLARPVSFANSMKNEEAKPIFEQAGMDFFDQHVYPSDAREYARTVQFFGDSRPVTFTEWGWEQVGGQDIFPETHSDYILDLVESRELAGHAFWSWQDVRQYGRIDWPTRNGILASGVVSESRDIRQDWYSELGGLFQDRRQEPQSLDVRPTVVPLKWMPASPNSSFDPVDLQPLVESAAGRKSWSALEAILAGFWPKVPMAEDQWKRTGNRFLLWKGPEAEIAGVPFRMPVVDEYVRPVVLTPEVPEVSIPIGRDCARLHILGQVTFPTGFPITGERGSVAATYTLSYAGGKEQELPLRNGIEAAQANLIYAATRINPIATAAQRALTYVKDVVREQYQVLLWSVPAERGKIESLRCKLRGDQPPLALFAITTEQAR